MGFYLRKAVRVGPLRFNLSKSGVGVSAGVTGLRLGTGPGGHYVHGGRHGLYYRKRLGGGSRRRTRGSTSAARPERPPAAGGHEAIDSGPVEAMVGEAAHAWVGELAEVLRRPRWLVLSAVGAAVLVAWSLAVGSGTVWLALFVGGAACAGAAYADAVRNVTVVLYDLEGAWAHSYDRLHDAFEAMAACPQVWHVAAEGRRLDPKEQAAADELLARQPIRLKKGCPRGLKTNVDVPLIPVGRQTLAFMPDCVLVFDKRAVGVVPYGVLQCRVEPRRWVETGPLPRGVEAVDWTWRFVNKDGSPDRRYRDNPQFPVAVYQDLCFESPTGLNERIQLAHPGLAEPFCRAAAGMAEWTR